MLTIITSNQDCFDRVTINKGDNFKSVSFYPLLKNWNILKKNESTCSSRANVRLPVFADCWLTSLAVRKPCLFTSDIVQRNADQSFSTLGVSIKSLTNADRSNSKETKICCLAKTQNENINTNFEKKHCDLNKICLKIGKFKKISTQIPFFLNAFYCIDRPLMRISKMVSDKNELHVT